MSISEDSIRELAYYIWLEEGCPEGQAARHWLQAEQELVQQLHNSAVIQQCDCQTGIHCTLSDQCDDEECDYA